MLSKFIVRLHFLLKMFNSLNADQYDAEIYPPTIPQNIKCLQNIPVLRLISVLLTITSEKYCT
jgi:hypothetical protein